MDSLTKMELIIISELATGDTLDVIAKRNHIAYTTVKKHADHIYEKLNVKNKCQAVSVYNLFLLEHP
jgi:DNA-binding CsgD family transcriptional regulator